MCDTFVVLPEMTKDGALIFGKNSDREPNEPQYVEILAEQNFPENSNVDCTYVSIPQVRKTYKVLLSRPVWIWGAEMGVNEFGVVIGNEAIFSKIQAGKESGLIGMDYLRLALERSKNALEAISVITDLLEIYGQSGDCGFSHPFYYHNSFLIADKNEAWKLETVDKQWAAKKISKMGSISNCLSIGTDWDMSSSDLVNFAKDQKIYNKNASFNFSEVYSDWLFTRFSNSKNRSNCTFEKILARDKQFQLQDAFQILRSHSGSEINFAPGRSTLSSDVCMHAGYGPIRVSQTTASLVTKNKENRLDIWFTGSSAPCLSLFKPSCMAQNQLFDFVPARKFETNSYWWRHESFHRKLLKNYKELITPYGKARDALESEFMDHFSKLESDIEKIEYWESVKQKSDQFLSDWVNISGQSDYAESNSVFYQRAWKKFNSEAEMTID